MKRTVLLGLFLAALLFVGLPAGVLSKAEAYAEGEELVELSFPDKKLYGKLSLELKGVYASKDDDSQTIQITQTALDGITELTLRCQDITNLTGLSRFTNLKRLDLCQNRISSVAELRTLTSLEDLNLHDNVIGDIDGLETLVNLTSLKLGYNNEDNKRGGIAHLDALKSMTKLEHFEFSQNYLPEITEIAGTLTNLKTLRLDRCSGNGKMDLAPLSKLTRLESISLYFNGLKDLSPLYGLSNLEEVMVQRNYLYSVSDLVHDGKPIWPKLRKLDIAKNNGGFDEASAEALEVLCQMSNAGELELNYEGITDTSALPHEDDAGKYVTYDDFGARCDGVYDDFIAMRNAHEFANRLLAEGGEMCEVRATPGKTYHVFKYCEVAAPVNTNVDWQGAEFVVHDEEIDEYIGRTIHLFEFTNTPSADRIKWDEGDKNTADKLAALNGANKLGLDTKRINGLEEALAPLNAKGYESYLCIAYDKEKRQYRRTGTTQSADMQDYFRIDREGNLLNDIQWDFAKLTCFEIIPIMQDDFIIKNGTWTTNAHAIETDCGLRSGKWEYLYRGFQFQNVTNLRVENVTHKPSVDRVSGTYAGFFNLNRGANITIENCRLWAQKYLSHSTYDLYLSRATNLLIKNVVCDDIYDTDRWGINGSNFLKDIRFENCTLNRIDAHQGMYNLYVTDCEIGSKGLTMTGQGDMDIIRTKVTSHCIFPLRGDYGSTWNGNARIIDCTWVKIAQKVPMLSQFSFAWDDKEHMQPHDFGYPCKFPNLYIDNLTIDYENWPNSQDYYAICNDYRYVGDYPWTGYDDYWPSDVHINRFSFLNNNRKNVTCRLTYSPIDKLDGNTYNYSVTDCTLTSGAGGASDVTRDCYGESDFTTDAPVSLSLKQQTSTDNAVTITKDGEPLEEETPVSGEVSRRFTKDGLYRIEISSVDRLHDGSNQGTAVYQFRIEGNDSSSLDVPAYDTPASSIYCWSPYSFAPKSSNGWLFDALNVRRVYQSFGADYAKILKSEGVASSVADLQARGIETYLLCGQPEWGMSEKGLAKAKGRIDAIRGYNEGIGADEPIAGVVFDIESFTSDAWKDLEADEPGSGFRTYVENMRELYEYADSNGVRVVLCIPRWLENRSAELLEELVRDCCDELSVMNYQVGSEVSDIETEIGLCQKYGKPVESIFNTMPPNGGSIPESSTYFNRDFGDLMTNWDALVQEYGEGAVGMSYHHFQNVVPVLTGGGLIAEVTAYTSDDDPARDEFGQTPELKSITLAGSDGSVVSAGLYHPALSADGSKTVYLAVGVKPGVAYTAISGDPRRYKVSSDPLEFERSDNGLVLSAEVQVQPVGEAPVDPSDPGADPGGEPGPDPGGDPEEDPGNDPSEPGQDPDADPGDGPSNPPDDPLDPDKPGEGPYDQNPPLSTDPSVHQHSWSGPSWAWSQDHRTAAAVFTCTQDSSHTVSAEASIATVKHPILGARLTATATFDGRTYSDLALLFVDGFAVHCSPLNDGFYAGIRSADGAEGSNSTTVLYVDSVDASSSAAVSLSKYIGNDLLLPEGSDIARIYDLRITVEGAERHDGFGSLSVSFPVGSENNGRSAKVYHFQGLRVGDAPTGLEVQVHDGLTVEGGFVSLEDVRTLSPFAVVLGPVESEGGDEVEPYSGDGLHLPARGGFPVGSASLVKTGDDASRARLAMLGAAVAGAFGILASYAVRRRTRT